jgi:hypothetical protein
VYSFSIICDIITLGTLDTFRRKNENGTSYCTLQPHNPKTVNVAGVYDQQWTSLDWRKSNKPILQCMRWCRRFGRDNRWNVRLQLFCFDIACPPLGSHIPLLCSDLCCIWYYSAPKVPSWCYSEHKFCLPSYLSRPNYHYNNFLHLLFMLCNSANLSFRINQHKHKQILHQWLECHSSSMNTCVVAILIYNQINKKFSIYNTKMGANVCYMLLQILPRLSVNSKHVPIFK